MPEGILKPFNIELSLKSLTPEDEWKPVAFKADGQRFTTSNSTLKLCCDSKYVLAIRTDTPLELDWWWMTIQHFHSKTKSPSVVATYAPAPLQMDAEGNFQYKSLWVTKGMCPTRKGDRHVVSLYLQGNDINISKQLQCKFYSKNDWHADYGHVCGGISFKCGLCPDGGFSALDEKFKLARANAQMRRGFRHQTL